MHYQKYLRLLLYMLPVIGYSQKIKKTECGTITTIKVMATYDEALLKSKERALKSPSVLATTYYVRVFIHDYISNTGSDSAWSKKEVVDEFNVAADLLRPYNICLVLGGIDYPRNTAFKDSFHTSNIGIIQANTQINHPSSIDVTLHKKLQNNDGGLNGICYDINGKWMSLSTGAITNRSFAHELGHCFGLLHTFEPAYGLECPDGSNSATAGDKITDTRATPVADSALSVNTSVACVYSGNLSINCNNANRIYDPEITNIMSYGRRNCRSVFSDKQVLLMKSDFDNNAVLQRVWFENINPITYAPFFNIPFYAFTDTVLIGSSIQLGNNTNGNLNFFMGSNAVQRVLSPSYIVITPGVQIAPSSTDFNRGSVVLSIATVCNIASTFKAIEPTVKEAKKE